MHRTALLFLCLGLSSPLLACATVELPKTESQRLDDVDTLRLRHVRLWTSGGYPLWLEVRTPRPEEVEEAAEARDREVTMVFTTALSARPRMRRCQAASLSSEGDRAEMTDVRYARTTMRLEAEEQTLRQRYQERGIVEDVYVSMSAERLLQLTAGKKLNGSLCQLGIRFTTAQRQQIRSLLQDAQRHSSAASLRASTMLSSMEQ